MVFIRGVLLIGTILVSMTIAFANPKQAAVHSRQGKAYFEARQYDQAIIEFKKAYDLEGKAVTLFKIASAYYAKADYQGAIDYYAKYLSADPEGPLAQQALEFTTIANKALADAKVKAEADAKAKADAEAKAKADVAAEQKRVAAAAHTKQAEAYAQAGAWASAGEEYLAAAAAGDNPESWLAAAEAFAKQPANDKALAAYQAYLENAPLGPKSDAIRGKVADLRRAIDKEAADKAKAAEDERLRKLQDSLMGRRGEPEKPRVTYKRGWIVVGGAAILTGIVADVAGPNGDNGKFDASDFAPIVLYGLGAGAVLRGVF